MKYSWIAIGFLLTCQGCYQSMGPKEQLQPPEETDTGDEPDSIVDLDTDFEEDTESETEIPTDTGEPLNWITIEGGAFEMGLAGGQLYQLPVHTVNVPTFDMTESEITVAQYALCVGAGACTEPSTNAVCDPNELGNWGAPGYENHPVNCVSWHQASEFCQWAQGRLPTESEWEYAAKSGGQEILHPWGYDPYSCDYAVVWSNTTNAQGPGCGTGHSWTVCSKPAGNSDQGLCDLVGNLWEWVDDYYHVNYVGHPTDGSSWETPENSTWSNYRVRRGYAYNQGWGMGNTDEISTSAARSASLESVQYDFMGFRCAR